MSGWSRTVRPKIARGNGPRYKDSNIFGVDHSEMIGTDGPQHAGWVWRQQSSGQGGTTRVRYETLVAMKTPPVENNSDDVFFPDAKIFITQQPVSHTVYTGLATTFSVTANILPVIGPTDTGLNYITYQWQNSTNGGATWSNIAAAGVYSTVTTHTLNISSVSGLEGTQYRCALYAPYTGLSTIYTSVATLYETPATTTVAPTTVAPTTLAPGATTTTAAPTTTTIAPTVFPTTTAAPTTVAPTTTAAPTTLAPTTTVAPTTAAPTTTVAPTTAVPTTAAPTTTVAPTTVAPTQAPTTTTTQAPTTTAAPTTLPPTTVAPTTVAPTTTTTSTTVAPTTSTTTTLGPF